jgi:drug/metabolite transporter (DMT)-like permease
MSTAPAQPTALSASPTGTATGLTLILCTLAGWTSIPLFLKFFSDKIDGWTANGWRYGLSAFLWLPVILWAWHKRTTPSGLWKAALWPSLFNALAQICFGLAPYFIDPGLMTFSLRLQIVVLMLGAAMLFPAERAVIHSALFLIGIATLLGGTVLVLLNKSGGLGEAKSALGIVIAVASGVLYACYALCVRKFMHAMPPLVAFAAVSQYTGAILVLLMLVFGERSGAGVFSLTPKLWFYLVLSAVVGIGLGHTMYYASIQRLGLALSAGIVQLQPITVSLCSIPLFGEKFLPIQWAAGVAAILGACLMLYAQQSTVRK